MDARLAELCRTHTRKKIAEELGLHVWRLDARLTALGLKVCPYAAVLAPKKEEWIAVAREKALAAKVRPSDVMAGARYKKAVHARWAAWKAMQDRYPQYSIAGIARTSGWDHTTVLHSLKRLNGASAKSLRKPSYRATARNGQAVPPVPTPCVIPLPPLS
jgi:hypothetical protein